MPREIPGLPPDHPLLRLEGRRLAGGRLRLFSGGTSRFGALYFSLRLEHSGCLSREPVLMRLYHSGPYPGYNWIEVAQVNERLTFGARDVGPGSAISAASLRRLMALLEELIPPGGHLMLEYESPRWASTARALNLGAPPAATELGELLRAAAAPPRSETGTSPREGARAPASSRASSPRTQAAPGPPARRETRNCRTSWSRRHPAHTAMHCSTLAAGRTASSAPHALDKSLAPRHPESQAGLPLSTQFRPWPQSCYVNLTPAGP